METSLLLTALTAALPATACFRGCALAQDLRACVCKAPLLHLPHTRVCHVQVLLASFRVYSTLNRKCAAPGPCLMFSTFHGPWKLVWWLCLTSAFLPSYFLGWSSRTQSRSVLLQVCRSLTEKTG